MKTHRWKYFLWTVAFLATLVVLFYVEEDWRGSRVLERVKRELAAQGEPLDTKALAPPPPIPNELNVAAAPIFAELFEERRPSTARLNQFRDFFAPRKGVPPPRPIGPSSELPTNVYDIAKWHEWFTGRSAAEAGAGVLAALEPSRGLVEEVRDALNRPGVVWPGNPLEHPFQENMSYVASGFDLSRFLALRATMEIDLGQGEAAVQDLVLISRLMEVVGKGPLVSYLVAIAGESNFYNALSAGLARHVWDEAQLRRLEIAMDRWHPLADFREAIRRERLEGIRFYELSLSQRMSLIKMVQGLTSNDPDAPPTHPAFLAFYIGRPKGWAKIDQAVMIRIFQDCWIAPIDEEGSRIDARRAKESWQEREKQRTAASRWFHPYLFLFISNMGENMPRRPAMCQAWRDEARTACALEMFRLRHGGLPETLDALAPDFLPELPTDPIDGQPLRYRREGKDYLLYSVGWDQKDDGGRIDRENKRLQGDWSWASRPDLYQFLPASTPPPSPLR